MSRCEPLLLSSDEEQLRFALATRRSTTRLAGRLASALRKGDLLVLSGELGVGKTFFVRAMCRALGVPATCRVTSPSFTLVNELTGDMPILHVDLYRLGDEDEVHMLGLDERRDDALMFVEWGAPYVDALGGEALLLELRIDEQHNRREACLSPLGASDAMDRAVAALTASNPR